MNENTTKSSYARVNIPAAFVRPYEFTSKAGDTFDKAYVSLPPATKINGIDVGNFSVDVFMNEHMSQQLADGRPVTLSFKTDSPVQIWKGRGEERVAREVDAWDLCKAVKAEFEAYKEAMAANRAEAAAAGAPSHARVNIPFAFVKPYVFTSKAGDTFDKAYVNLPPATTINGEDLTGFTTDVFMNEHMAQQMLSGKPVTLSFKTDKPVQIWKGRGEERVAREVDAWDLCKAVKAELEQFKADRAAERAEGPSLADAAGMAQMQQEADMQAEAPSPAREDVAR